MRRFAQIIGLCVVVVVVGLAGGAGAETLYVDDNAPSDPGAGDPLVSDPAEDGSPAHPFDAIQEAIDAASDDDMVIVRDGTYTGEGNRDINFNGKAVHLMSEDGPDNCVIDCEGAEADLTVGSTSTPAKVRLPSSTASRSSMGMHLSRRAWNAMHAAAPFIASTRPLPLSITGLAAICPVIRRSIRARSAGESVALVGRR